MKNPIRLFLFLLFGLHATLIHADAVPCETLPHWSTPIPTGTDSGATARVNLHHIFCGEPGRRGRAKGFHAVPGGLSRSAPRPYVNHGGMEGPNAEGVYTLRNITLRFEGETYDKFLSTMFPDACTQAQVLRSVVYANTHNAGSCANPHWAVCGPSAPPDGGTQYCLGNNGKAFTIAGAPKRNGKINTGFPIYE